MEYRKSALDHNGGESASTAIPASPSEPPLSIFNLPHEPNILQDIDGIDFKHTFWLQSAVDSSFWAELTTLKLHRLKLSEEAVDIKGAAR